MANGAGRFDSKVCIKRPALPPGQSLVGSGRRHGSAARRPGRPSSLLPVAVRAAQPRRAVQRGAAPGPGGAGGGRPEAFSAFLRRERLGRFLNPDEVRAVLRSAQRPSEEGAAAAAEDSFGSSHDCSSGTYFPEQSDLEPPLLELGWPAFYQGAYRGATRVEAHFQPRGAGAGGPYGCKDALRQQLRSAREVSGPAGPRGPPRRRVAPETLFSSGRWRAAGRWAGLTTSFLGVLPEWTRGPPLAQFCESPSDPGSP